MTARGYYQLAACVGTFEGAGIGALSHVAALLRVGLEPCSMTMLADHLEISRAGVTQVVDGLETLGLVCRVPLAGDRRTWMIHMTDKGLELVRSAFQAALNAETKGGAAS